MKFMLMMSAPRGNGEWNVMDWKPEELKAHILFMKGINKMLVENGEWVDGQGLAPPGAAKLVKAKPAGGYDTDGPFAESKEFLAGFWIVDVESRERVYQLAGQISLAPGKGGAPMYMSVEVREVMSAPQV